MNRNATLSHIVLGFGPRASILDFGRDLLREVAECESAVTSGSWTMGTRGCAYRVPYPDRDAYVIRSAIEDRSIISGHLQVRSNRTNCSQTQRLVRFCSFTAQPLSPALETPADVSHHFSVFF
jgi:hypothetical protein